MGKEYYFPLRQKSRHLGQQYNLGWTYQRLRNKDCFKLMSWMNYDRIPYMSHNDTTSKGLDGMISLSRKRSSKMETGHYYLIPGSRISEENFTPDGSVHMRLIQCMIVGPSNYVP
jgi:hypothetical protein